MNGPTLKNKTWLERLSLALLREPQDQEQLLALLRDAEQRDLFDADALMMIEGVLQVANLQVRDIMIPRSQMNVIRDSDSLNKIRHQVVDGTHSRYPVIGDDRDEVIGILLAKDLLEFSDSDEDRFDIHDIMRPAIFVPESKRLNVLLQEFRRNRNHIAIVIDEYGGVCGLVTIEDVLEQIVGDIEDEYDTDEESFIRKHSERKFMVSALTPIQDFNEYFQCTLPQEEFDTMGGLVAHAFGHVPKRGERTKVETFTFKVISADGRRIRLLQLTVPRPLHQTAESAS